MSSSFGARTDWFGLADSDWELVESSKTPEASSAQAQDEIGDVACEVEYEETDSVEATYRCKSNGTGGMVDLPANFKGGTVNTVSAVDYVITGGNLNTSNTERPTLTVSGEKVHGPSDGIRVYDFAAAIGDIHARKVASAIGFVLGASTLLNSSSASFSTDVTRTLDGDGAIAVLDLAAGRIEASGDLVSCSGTPTATAASGFTLARGNDASESNTAHTTGTVNVYQNLAADVEATA